MALRNELRGPIPEALLLSDITVFAATSNRLSGTLPLGLSVA